jgi:hypothetical protein
MNKLDAIMSSFDKLKDEQRELQKKFQEASQSLLKEGIKSFFEMNPGVAAIKWAQYTPYFNDGDECVFNVYDVNFTNATGDDLDDVSTWGEYEGENESVWCESHVHNLKDKEGVDAGSCEAFAGLIGSYDMRDVMQEMFGDHISVTITRDGIDVDDYEHE